MMRTLAVPLVAVALLLAAPGANAEVTRVDIATRADVGGSGYEKMVGIVHFDVDPKDPHNNVVVDLDKASVNAAGHVEFSADLYILRPKDASKSNGVAIVGVMGVRCTPAERRDGDRCACRQRGEWYRPRQLRPEQQEPRAERRRPRRLHAV